MEIAHVERLVIDYLGEQTELRGRELLGQQVEQQRAVVVGLAAHSLQCLGYDEVVVEGKRPYGIDRHPCRRLAVHGALQRRIELDYGEICYGDDALDMGLLGTLEPDDITRIARTVFRAERLELCQPYIFDTCEFGQYAGGSLVEVLVLINQ